MKATYSLFGKDLFGEDIKPKPTGPLAERFIFPPFSVFDARQGEWQRRKRAWIAVGIQSELGRKTEGNNALGSLSLRKKEQAESTQKIMNAGLGILFDPTLCEIIYRWFCPQGGQVVDPFAGGSVRGIVAALMGLKYWGCDP